MTDPDTRGWRTSLRRHDPLVCYVLTLALSGWFGVVGQLSTWIPAMRHWSVRR
jgi:hypothetical protein